MYFEVNSSKRVGNSKTTQFFFPPAVCGWPGRLQLGRKPYTLAYPTTIQDDKENQVLQSIKHLHYFSCYTNNWVAIPLFVDREKTKSCLK